MSRVNWSSARKQSAPRLSFSEYGIIRKRYLELRNGCAAEEYSLETLREACRGFEFLESWILLSVTKKRSYEGVEYAEGLGRIPCGRTDFYGFRRKFYHNLNLILKEDAESEAI